MLLSSYLYFDGQCEAAFKFYERCAGWQNRGDDTPRGLVGCGPRACGMAQQGPARTHGCERPGIDGFRRTSRPLPQTLGLLREHCGEGRGPGRAHLSRAVGKRDSNHADRRDLLGCAIWYARR